MEKTVPYENFKLLARINETQEREIQKLRAKKRELERQIELLKKFNLLGDILNYEKRNICNLR